MAILEGGHLTGRLGVVPPHLDKLWPGNSFCNCCAAVYNMHEDDPFYGIAVSETPMLHTVNGGAVTTDVVTLPDGNKLYVTLATEAFEGGDDDDY